MPTTGFIHARVGVAREAVAQAIGDVIVTARHAGPDRVQSGCGRRHGTVATALASHELSDRLAAAPACHRGAAPRRSQPLWSV